jgi:hypothetical protein
MRRTSVRCVAGSGIGIEGGDPLISNTLVRDCARHGVAIFAELGGSEGLSFFGTTDRTTFEASLYGVESTDRQLLFLVSCIWVGGHQTSREATGMIVGGGTVQDCYLNANKGDGLLVRDGAAPVVISCIISANSGFGASLKVWFLTPSNCNMYLNQGSSSRLE